MELSTRGVDLRLEDLTPPRSAEITYRTRGCFHGDFIRIVFRGDDLEHAEVSRPGDPEMITRMEVPRDDLASVDRLLDHWRSTQGTRGPLGTSDTELQVVWWDGESVLGDEDFPHAFPPPDLRKEYFRFFMLGVTRALRERTAGIAEARREEFREWALDHFPLRELRYLDETTLYALVDSERAGESDAEYLAHAISSTCSEHTGRAKTACHVYVGKTEVARTAFDADPPTVEGRVREAISLGTWALVAGLLLALGGLVWLLSWPIRRAFGALSRHGS